MLGMFAQTHIVKLLTSDTPIRIKVGTKMLALEGREYSNTIDDNSQNYEPLVNNVDFNILVNHGMLLDKEYIPGVSYTRTKDILSPANITIGGHYHYGFKEHEENGGMFFNPGSLLRTEASKANKDFVPKTLVIDLNDVNNKIEYTYKYVPLASAEDSSQIFDFNAIQQKKDATSLLDQFKQFVVNTSSVTASASVEDMIQTVSTDNSISPDVTTEALRRIAVSHSNDISSLSARGFIESNKKLFIKKMMLDNFQSHAHTEVDFTDGFNVIIGETNSGKTSILRALQWVLYNDPKGSDFIRTGFDDCSVTITFSDGTVITRSRSRSSAGEYTLATPTGTTQVYRGFGNDIPIEIFNAHQMPLVELSKGTELSLNIASQLEGPFLVSMNQSDKANAIGRIIGSQVLDGAIKEVSKEITSINRDISYYKKEIDAKELAKKDYDFLPERLQAIERISFMLKNAETMQGELDAMTEVFTAFNQNGLKILEVFNKIDRYKNLKKFDAAMPKIDLIIESLSFAETLNEDYSRIEESISDMKAKAKKNANILFNEDAVLNAVKERESIDDMEDLLGEYCDVSSKMDSLLKKKSALPTSDIDEANNAAVIANEITDLCALEDEYQRAKEAYEEIKHSIDKKTAYIDMLEFKLAEGIEAFKAYLKQNNICPLCERPFDDHTIEHIAN